MFGNILKKLMIDKEISQKEFAKVLNVSEQTISGYVKNLRTPNDDIKAKIADYFGVSLDYLMGRTVEVKEKNLPLELQGIGLDSLEVLKEIKETGLSNTEIMELLKLVKKFKER